MPLAVFIDNLCLNDYPGSKGIETSQKRKPARAIACLNDYPGHKGAETR